MTLRRGTNCVKWDAESPAGPIGEDVIPLWVADMDFKVAPAITKVLKERVDQGIFGYTHIPDSYYESAIRDMVVNSLIEMKAAYEGKDIPLRL